MVKGGWAVKAEACAHYCRDFVRARFLNNPPLQRSRMMTSVEFTRPFRPALLDYNLPPGHRFCCSSVTLEVDVWTVSIFQALLFTHSCSWPTPYAFLINRSRLYFVHSEHGACGRPAVEALPRYHGAPPESQPGTHCPHPKVTP